MILSTKAEVVLDEVLILDFFGFVVALVDLPKKERLDFVDSKKVALLR